MARALLSVSDKTEIGRIAKELTRLGYEIVSTGGTGKALTDAGVPFTPIVEVTHVPECMNDRLKTINHLIEGAILFDRNDPEQIKDAARLGIVPIDIVVCNLYDFPATIRRPDFTYLQVVEKIDVGGPTMIGAAAKNAEFVTVVVDPADYDRALHTLEFGGEAEQQELREILQAKAIRLLADFYRPIANYLEARLAAKLNGTGQQIKKVQVANPRAFGLAEQARAVVRAFGLPLPHPLADDPGNVPSNENTDRLSFTEGDLTIDYRVAWTTTAMGNFKEWHLTVTWGQRKKLKARYRGSTPEDIPGQIQFLSCSEGTWEAALVALAERAAAAIKA